MWLPRVIFSVILPYIKACARHGFLLCFSLALLTAVSLLGLPKETEFAVMLPICVSVLPNSFSIHEKILTKADGQTEVSKTKNSTTFWRWVAKQKRQGGRKPLSGPQEKSKLWHTLTSRDANALGLISESPHRSTFQRQTHAEPDFIGSPGKGTACPTPTVPTAVTLSDFHSQEP